MIKSILWKILLKSLSWIIENGDINVYSSRIPVGSRIGGKDIPELPDLYIVLHIELGHLNYTGYFQKS